MFYDLLQELGLIKLWKDLGKQRFRRGVGRLEASPTNLRSQICQAAEVGLQIEAMRQSEEALISMSMSTLQYWAGAVLGQ